MELKNTKEIEDLVAQTSVDRDRVRELVYQGKWLEAEPDAKRRSAFTRRRARKTVPPGGPESLIGKTIDLQGVNFLTEGAHVRRCVAHLDVTGPTGAELGTGFMISPRLLITNRHVIPDVESARGTLVSFDKEIDDTGTPAEETTYRLDPDSFFASDETLDYAVIAMGERKRGSGDASALGYCVLSDDPDKHVLGMNVNIIQHPMGRPKMIAVRNNILMVRKDRTLLYETDTEVGSSGSPVFNDDWDLVALHHWGQEHLDANPSKPNRNVNEGVRISAIYRDLKNRLPAFPAEQRALLEDALSFAGSAAPTPPRGRVLSPPRPLPQPVMVEDRREEGRIVSNQTRTQDGVTFTVPIEVHVRIGSPDTSAPPTLTQVAPRAKTLTPGAEALKVDTDYANRTGYDPKFIPGTTVALPTVRGGADKRVAPLRASEPNAERGELRYEHFSIKMNKQRRMALFTATNIDGATYLEVDRETGLVREEEGEKWFIDPRISASFFLDQSFYSEWSHYFDRGHLTRRSDPTWGHHGSAERANADTYHFTNCSPQAWRFNQKTQYWQGAERYILEHGVLSGDERKRISVFTGPAFDDTVDWYADDVQLPSMFFKVVVWPGAESLKSIGLLVEQKSLYNEPRSGYAPPGTGPIDVSQWRVPIKVIEDRTGLDFDKDIVDGDTMSQPGQPTVGEEAARLLRSFEDLLL